MQMGINFNAQPFRQGGVVKITDFGLGKIIKEEPEPQRMELMSQVAEFYWYSPPKCLT
ncbi:serine/threonine-protein kinase TOUSLED-like [Physcomitrium patens]|uniref:serine/threonine-protein kinase TOUSLED-like n=1 Tax=Physcomitrium patens TaxID=3218 RepID=UPI003CCE1DAF